MILQEAQDLGVELIVIGSHSQSMGVCSALGRTCMRLLQQTKVPVYLVPIIPEGGGC
ncbi:Universal stress protein family protein [compost metagenome]